MPQTNLTLDYFKVKVFLYKYTPEFTAVKSTSIVTSGTLKRIDRYKVELDEDKYFTKYDISDYIASYSFTQDLHENTYDWSVTLHDPILTFSQINDILKVKGNTKWDSNNISRLATYETQARNIAAESNYIKKAKLKRGKQTKSFNVKDSIATDLLTRQDASVTTPILFKNTAADASGLRLSDLIQPYDMISVFLYSGKHPLEDLTGDVITNPYTHFQVFQLDSNSINTLTAKNLQVETILLSPTPDKAGISNNATLFNKEFVGFVLNKSMTVSPGAVDVVTVSGHGVSRLFGMTRRVLKPSAFQKSIFDEMETSGGENDFSAFMTNFVGKKIHQIFQELYDACYRISFDKSETTGGSIFTTSTVNSATVPPGSFLDISSLKVHNTNATNMFCIPPFLVSLVLKLHGFKYRDVKTPGGIDILASKAKNLRPTIMVAETEFENDEVISTNELVISSPKSFTVPSTVDKALNDTPTVQTRAGIFNPVYMSSELNSLRPYFKFFEKVMETFSPMMKTPYEIIDELREKLFLEFIDKPDGSITIRAPQYNSIVDVVYGSTLDSLSSTYTTDSSAQLTRQTVKNVLDTVGQFNPFEYLAFTDGKLLLQYGQLEGAAEANPNYISPKVISPSLNNVRERGILEYAEYLLRLNNASFYTGAIVCVYDPRIQVGRTFFDDKLGKFGYITSVSKNIAVGGEATISFTLSYVRDAVLDNGVLSFQQLPTLLDVSNGFNNNPSLTIPEADPDQRLLITGDDRPIIA